MDAATREPTSRLRGCRRAVFAPVERWAELVGAPATRPRAALLRADLPRQRPLAALAVGELRRAGLRVRIASRAPGRVATRRAISGIDPGGDCARRSRRLARGLLPPGDGRPGPRAAAPATAARRRRSSSASAWRWSPVHSCSPRSAARSAATSRGQRAADLAALSGARSMRDDFARLFVPVRRDDGSVNPAHLSKHEYLARARDAALEAARANGVEPRAGRGRLPRPGSFAPLHVRARIEGELELGDDGGPATRAERVIVSAEAEAVPPPPRRPRRAPAPAYATGGGYSGRLEYRGGEGMRPDVAAAFDRMAPPRPAAGYALYVNSGFRSDAEQAVLWAANPDPRWVAPPGTSLHRCATELDLGPEAAYGWLAANAGRFGFVQRYSWEEWHYGYVAGPAPCSPQGDAVGTAPSNPSAVPRNRGGAVRTPGRPTASRPQARCPRSSRPRTGTRSRPRRGAGTCPPPCSRRS